VAAVLRAGPNPPQAGTIEPRARVEWSKNAHVQESFLSGLGPVVAPPVTSMCHNGPPSTIGETPNSSRCLALRVLHKVIASRQVLRSTIKTNKRTESNLT